MMMTKTVMYLQGRWREIAIFFFIAVPILNLFINVISWLEFGIDLPYFDDWETLIKDKAGDFSLGYLFAHANDTLCPLGFVLDSLAYRYLNGNVIAYQFISLIFTLGALLFLQWQLLMLALKDRLLAACAFSFTLFMLQPDTYWGLQYMAYQQALPLVFVLAAIYIILGTNWCAQWKLPTLLTLGFLSGLTYISGAFAILTLGIVFIASSQCIQVADRKPLWQAGFTLLIPGIITTVTQLQVLFLVHKGGTHIPGVPLAYPFESDFWIYFLGKIGRALMLLPQFPKFSLVIVSLAVVVVLAVLIYFLKQCIKGKKYTLIEARTMLLYMALLSIVFVYLSMVSAGRANLGTEGMSLLQVFSLAFARFHFFWITLLWPWLIAAIFTILNEGVFSLNKIRTQKIAVFSVLIVCCLLWRADVFKHGLFYQEVMDQRAEQMKCLIMAVQKGQKIVCPELYFKDLTQAFLNAKREGVSFTRTIPN